MRNKLSLCALIVFAGFGVGHATVRASSLDPAAAGPAAACSRADGDARSATSTTSSPYYCICCDATGDARCCSKC